MTSTMDSQTQPDLKASEYSTTAPPPPYEDDTTDSDSSGSDSDHDYKKNIDRFGTNPAHQPVSGGIKLPVVIPQTTKVFKGAFHSPFVRAYAPELEAHGIKQEEFLTVIDGMNEAFVVHPIFQGLGVVGGVMQLVYGVQPVQWAGAGLQVASGAAGAATSYARTRGYVKEVNRDLFHPAGLHLNVLTTKKMMEKVGYPEDKLQLPPLQTMDDLYKGDRKLKKKEAIEMAIANSPEEDDPQMRRIRALKGYVMPLKLDVPPAVEPENLLRKMGASRAKRLNEKQERKLIKKRTREQRRAAKGSRGVERRERRTERRTDEIEQEYDEKAAVLEQKISESRSEREQDKAQKQLDRERRAADRKLEKLNARHDRVVRKRQARADGGDKETHEEKKAQKVRWIILSTWKGDEDSDADSIPGSDSEATGDAGIEKKSGGLKGLFK